MTRRLIVAVVMLLALAGCGGDPKADPSPTPSASPVGTTPPASPAPTMPDAAKANTKAGAIAFVRHYVRLVNHAQHTGDLAALRAVEAPGCESCEKVRRSIAQIYERGGSIEGGDWRPHLNVALQNADGSWLVSGYLRFDPERVQKSSDSSVMTSQGGSAFAQMTVRQARGIWKVVKWSRNS